MTCPAVVAGTYCHNASGVLNLTVTSQSPVFSILSTFAYIQFKYDATDGSLILFNENTTSSAVI